MPQTLLLADDSVTIQRVIELTFADEDIDVVAVSDGDEAIARLEAMPPDIVLADIGMPGKSGYEVAAYVKHTPRLAHIPVVLLTGAFEPVDEARASAAGCDGVLAKPFEPQQVIGRVRELLGRIARPAASLDAPFGAAPAAPVADLWASASVDVTAGGSKKIDDYFDELDAAFSNLSGKPFEGTARTAPAVDVDWFGLKSAVPAEEVPDVSIPPHEVFGTPEATDLFLAPPPPVAPAPAVPAAVPAPEEAPDQTPVSGAAFDRAPAAAPAIAPAAAPARVAPSSAAASATFPPLADAFAALLEAEQAEPAAGARPAWPSVAGSGPVVSDDLVEQISRRVLAQLTDRVVRETVASLAERMISEEIERIKASIK